MSFQSLISGSECAAPSNPLSQVLKHTEGDRSLQQDRISGSSSSRLHQLPGSSSSAPATEHDLALARQFFEVNGSGFSITQGPSMYPSELVRLAEAGARPGMSVSWIIEQQQQMRAYEESAETSWAAEFGTSVPQQAVSHTPQQQGGPGRIDFQQRSMYMSAPQSMYHSMQMNMPLSGLGSIPVEYANVMNQANQGKGKAREADFEAAFAQFAAETQTSRIEEVGDDSATSKLEDALKSVTLNAKEADEGPLDFQRVWDQLQNSDLPPPQEDMAKWEAEFSQLMNSERNELEDYGANMQNVWESGLGNFNDTLENSMKFDGEGIPILGDYIFEQNNKFLEPTSSRSLLNDAKALLEQNGSLSEAALMLEAAIQQSELGEGGYETWILLGETRNMDEREEAGMRALLEGAKRAEESGSPGPGLLSLAISFTNESYDRASHTMLLRWFRARYPDVPVAEETIKAMTTNSSWDTHERITQLFLELARIQHSQDKMDADLQIALGVLFYTNGEYERAQDCFVTALNVRPKDYLLWNRLGSSMSNGNKPEEALGAYREALQLRPTYTRAIYNVGVACLNIGADKEAAEHFLSALSLQASTSGDTSDQLWFTLRRALQSMKRNDLADLAKPEAQTHLDVFRREGFDF